MASFHRGPHGSRRMSHGPHGPGSRAPHSMERSHAVARSFSAPHQLASGPRPGPPVGEQLAVAPANAGAAQALQASFGAKVSLLTQAFWNFKTPEHVVVRMVQETLFERQKLILVALGVPVPEAQIAGTRAGDPRAVAAHASFGGSRACSPGGGHHPPTPAGGLDFGTRRELYPHHASGEHVEECGDWKRGDCRRGDSCRYTHSAGASVGGGPGAVAAPRAHGERGAMQEQAGNWKGHLDTAYCRAKRQNSNFSYTTVDVPGKEGAFVSQISSPDFLAVYIGEHANSQKRAEHNAAEKAMASEFPAEHEALMLQNGHQEDFGPAFAGGQPSGKKKRVRPGNTGFISAAGMAQKNEPKVRLQEAAQLLLGRSLVKGDVVFEHQDADNGRLILATVVIPQLDSTRAFYGEPAETKKLAENSACEALLNSDLAPEIARLEVEHQERKARKQQEDLENKRARRDQVRYERGDGSPV